VGIEDMEERMMRVVKEEQAASDSWVPDKEEAERGRR
jgi:hypothetical protein